MRTFSKLLVAAAAAMFIGATIPALAQVIYPKVTAVATTNNLGQADGFFAAQVDIPGGKKVLVRCKASGEGCQTRVID